MLLDPGPVPDILALQITSSTISTDAINYRMSIYYVQPDVGSIDCSGTFPDVSTDISAKQEPSSEFATSFRI